MVDLHALDPEVPQILCTWNVPSPEAGVHTQIAARAGEVTTIVGANGAGKSALGGWLVQTANGPVRRLIAHRKLWFQSAGSEISPSQRESALTSMSHWDRQPNSRYLDHADGTRTNVVLFDLLAGINEQNREMVRQYQSGATTEVVEKSLGMPLLNRLNTVLRASGLPIEIDLTATQMYEAVNHSRSARYPASQMSDGEKSALLLASEILTAPRNTVVIIDEPERHLHRAISGHLIESVIADRSDCHFVVLTHDLDLAAALGAKGATFVLGGSTWISDNVANWELLPVASDGLPESARRAILGGRREVLLIEGSRDSLDLSLYRLLFPGWNLSPAGGCDNVIRGVTGLRKSTAYHWTHARGIVDGDGRTDEERTQLTSRGIVPLPVCEVESLYYRGIVMQAVASKQAAALERSAPDLLNQATEDALQALSEPGNFERLAGQLALSALRRRVLDSLPTSIQPDSSHISVSIASPYQKILTKVTTLYEARDLESLTKLLPIRDTGMRARVARALAFRNVADYESAARVCIRDQPDLAAALRTLIDQEGVLS